MKPGYKKKAVTSKKKLAKQKRKDAKHPEIPLSEKADVVLDVEPAAMGATRPLLRREMAERTGEGVLCECAA